MFRNETRLSRPIHARTLVAIVLAALASHLEDDVAAAEDAGRLVLAATTHKSSYSLYEPVVVTYSVSNPTPEPIMAGFHMHSSRFITIARSDGEGLTRCRSGPIAASFTPARPHAPGEVLGAATSLLWNDYTQSIAFPNTGEYVIMIGLRVYSSNHELTFIRADPVTISVVAPEGPDLALLDQVGSGEGLVDFLLHKPHYDLRTPKEILELARRYPMSAYSPYLVRRLADTRFRGAVEAAELFLARWPEHPLAPNVMLRLIRLLLPTDAARARLEEFERRWPDRGEQAERIRRALPAPVADD